jgi:uncharacterized membrane protein
MEKAHTPASYFIAIAAVLGGALMMPTFPIFIIIVCPLLLLGIVVYALLRRKQSSAYKNAISSGVRAVPTYTQASTAGQIVAEEIRESKRPEREAISV